MLFRLITTCFTFLVFLDLVFLSVLKITNFKCNSLDPPFATFEKCRLKVVKRGVVSAFVHLKLHQLPVTNISMIVSLYQKLNGYRPFMYNFSVNFCDFMSHRTRNPPLKIIFDLVADFSNINHTCPYNHDIIVSNLTLEEKMFKQLPLPLGDFMVHFIAGAYNHWKADVKIYVTIF